jgi:hypothetical protein
MIAALGVNFSKSLGTGQNFVLAQKVSPESSPDQHTLRPTVIKLDNPDFQFVPFL